MIGKWNASVILTYVGLFFALLGIRCLFVPSENAIDHAISCLMVSGVCDLFDGSVARRIKRTEEEKRFGIELDSLVDAISFIALPVVLLFFVAGYGIISLAAAFLYAVCGIARLAYFNIETADEDHAIAYYTGLPMTYAALVFPLVFLLHVVLSPDLFQIVFQIVFVLTGICLWYAYPFINQRGRPMSS